MKRYLLKALLLCACVLPIAGCHKTSVAPLPALVSQVDDFDGATYRALVVLQASLNSLKTSIEADPDHLGSLKPSLNAAIASYDTAIGFYKIYHATQSNQAQVTASLNQAQTALAGLQAQVTK